MSMDYHATQTRSDRKVLMRLRLAVLATLLTGWLATLTTACSSPLTDARTSFDEARYPDAVAEYRALAPQVAALSRSDLFEYALYRGLAHLALGDSAPAERWLLLAKRLSEESPALASADERGRLLSAWRSMGHMPGD
jgi:hypothetical protein